MSEYICDGIQPYGLSKACVCSVTELIVTGKYKT